MNCTGIGRSVDVRGVALIGLLCVVMVSGIGCSSTSGPSESGEEDLSETVLVAAGSFTMGDGVAHCGTSERIVTLTRDFYLGRYEVTNQEYVDALQWAYDQDYITVSSSSVQDNLDGSTVELFDLDGVGSEIAFSGGVFSLSDAGHGDNNGNHPVKEATWYGAARYCDWLSLQEDPPLDRAYEHTGDWLCNGGDPYAAEGYRLPTDAEWEYSAQYDDDRVYPWGNADPTCDTANYGSCIGWTVPVGSYPDGKSALGMYDMAGNVSEWVNDRWTCDLGVLSETDPVGSGTGCVTRGGYALSLASGIRCAFRGNTTGPAESYSSLGFRIARTASQ